MNTFQTGEDISAISVPEQLQRRSPFKASRSAWSGGWAEPAVPPLPRAGASVARLKAIEARIKAYEKVIASGLHH